MERLVSETFTYQGIPLATLAPEGVGSLPTVLFIHGLMGDKSQGMQLGYILARSGFFFAALDAPLHGERDIPHFSDVLQRRGLTWARETRLDEFSLMLEVVDRAADDVIRVVDLLAADSRVDPGRVGIAGFSMGGFTAFLAIARDERLKAAVSIAAAPSFGLFWRDLLRKASRQGLLHESDRLADETARRTAAIERLDPIGRLTGLSSLPLLMLHGRDDREIPRRHAERLYGTLKTRYEASPERLQLKLHPTGHRLTTTMAYEASEWFERFL